MQLALGDALAIALLEAKGFTAQKFRVFHPGGKLGARLTFVRDVMHQGERVPLVGLGARMGQAVVEMSGKGFGCVCIIDANGVLAGIITDGDLRRHMKPDLMAHPVETVMSRAPITIAPDVMAAEAVEILNSNKKTVLIVVDDERHPTGIVHIHDLLRLGAA
jgi:arabinose-5-phosphate isomerase